MIVAVAGTVAAIVVVALVVQPASSGGLVALVIAATAFPSIALWASRISNIELVQSTARSAKARNELIGIAITGLRDDVRTSAESQSRALVAAISSLKQATEQGSAAVVSEVRALGETISRVSADQVRAIGEERAAIERQEQATRELAQIQVQAEERARPAIYVQTQIRSAWLFWHHNWILVANTEGPAHGILVSYRFLQQNDWERVPVGAFDLGPQQQRQFDLGDVSNTHGSNHVWLLIRYRDGANRQYLATVDLPLGENQWRPTQARPVV